MNIVPKQFQYDFLTSKARFPSMVAGWGTGKTMFAIMKGYNLSMEFPGNLGLVVRKNFTDLKDSTIRDFTKYTGIKVPTSKDVKLPNGSVIMFRHMDELAGVVQNVNLGWFYIEQAEEFDTDTEFQKLRGRLRRDNVGIRQGFVIANANGHNWVWRNWINDPSSEEYHCIQATTFDNASNLQPDFIEDLKAMEKESPSNYRRYVLNSHEDIDTADRVISYDTCRAAINRYVYYTDVKRVIACDPAEFGDDYSIIYVIENGKIVDQKAFRKKELMTTAGECVLLRRQWNASLIAVDDIGLGAGVRSRLNELGEPVMGVNVGTKSSDGDKWRNLKAEIWMHAKKEFEDGNICLTDDEELIEQLTSVRYLVNSRGQIQIEPKKETIKRLGHSPDKADAFVLGLWALSKAEAMEGFDLEDHETDLANSYSVTSLI